MNTNSTITDAQREEFIRLLNGKVTLTRREQDYADHFLCATHSGWWTSGRRALTDLMWRRYGVAIKNPFPL